MSAAATTAAPPTRRRGDRPRREGVAGWFSLSRLIRIVVLALVDLGVASVLPGLFDSGTWFFGVAVALVTVGVNVVVLVDRLVPVRWLAPGLVLLILMTLAPILYTCYVAFTNYSDNHLLSKDQAITALQADTYLPDGAQTTTWKAYRADDGSTALWLAPTSSTPALLVTSTGTQREAPAGQGDVGPLTDGGPSRIAGYTRLSLAETVRQLATLQNVSFGPTGQTIKIASLSSAAHFVQRYHYDRAADTVLDTKTTISYAPREGTFTSADGQTLTPSFRTTVGFANFADLFADAQIRSVAFQIFVWTVIYAVVVVAVQFVAGLVVSLALGDASVPRRLAKVLRSIMLLPYVIPAFLGILVWGAMLNPNIGIVTTTLSRVFGISPDWVLDPLGAKFAVLLITFWQGFPYFVLIVSGALNAIPEDLLEAADVDGAGVWQRFRHVTFPLLMKTVGPLIVLGMAFNFNNFMVIYLYNSGGPPFAGVNVPAGHTDLLISFTYKLAFTFGSGANYGLAAVISMLLFVILAPIVLSQFRHYAVWQEED